MAGTTSPDNIPYLTTGDGVIDTAYTVALAEAVQDALDTRAIKTYRWANQAARTAQAGMAAGDQGYQIDTDRFFYYTGTTWRIMDIGVRLPSSVTNATINENGSIRFTAAASVAIQGVFSSSLYDLYQIDYDITTSASAAIQFFLASGGTSSITGYDANVLAAVGATVAPTNAQGLNGANGSLQMANILGGRHKGTMSLGRPGQAISTMMTLEAFSADNPGTTAITYGKRTFSHRVATAYDGFNLAAGSGTISGTIVVRGMG